MILNVSSYFALGVIHKQRLQEEVGRWSKILFLFVKVYKVENVNEGERGGGQKKPKACQHNL